MPSIDDEDGYDSSPPFAKKTLSKAERRAEHNAIERARRESLNNKFQQLAQALPNLMNYRRPSKSQIVEKALDWVKKSISREERYRYQVIQLQKENKKLLAQLTTANPTSDTITSPTPSPSASISTPTPSDNRHQQHRHTYDPHVFQQHQQYYQQQHHRNHYHHQNTPHPSVSATTESSSSSSSVQHHLSDFTTSSATTTAQTAVSSAADFHHPFLYDLPAPSSWLPPHQNTPSSLSSHTYGSMDDLNHSYDKKDIDPAVFQSPPSTDFYLDTMMMPGQNSNRLPPSPGFIQPTASRSTPAFSSSRRR
ncbi:hypothetical protein BCR42DRAFT_437892 [Absidia repens]|uniref:BHLH domain-containing protein n=1 Tax=Absidia repens TaxID=90262 RepID=A0A1X2IFE6_9FUNG|nr:hypothetical protein BCR42DRAFT_437892 [Absidia repens]